MCRNIRPLHNFEPPASSDEVSAAALQYVRKVSGTVRPSKANQEAFDRAVAAVAHATQHLLDELVTQAPKRDREVEAAKARERGRTSRLRDLERLASEPQREALSGTARAAARNAR
jgi:hypothetical protein